MSFKKRETNQNKIRHPDRKRKISTTIALSLSLLFGKARLSSSQSSSLNFDNKVVQERIIDDQEFCSFEENDQQVILVKNNSSSPTVRPGLATGFSSKNILETQNINQKGDELEHAVFTNSQKKSSNKKVTFKEPVSDKKTKISTS